ncbi:MAG TPA: oligosaccharide flippase family protein [Acidimicrobiales bacterium]|nr:oligosaccharide flippase family protein [Acidimicrobiales bacterium]
MSAEGPGDPVFTSEPILADTVGTPLLPDSVETAPRERGRLPSLSGNSAARLVADMTALGMALVSATVTARLLGPSGKGYYSSLLLLGGVFVVCFSAGLGEAVIVLAGRGKVTVRTAVAATMGATLGLSVLGALVFVAAAYLTLGADTTNDRVAILLGAVGTGLNVQYNTMAAFLLSQERVVAVAGLAIAAAAISTGALWVLVAGTGLGIAGALLGSVVGSAVVLVATITLLRRTGLSLRPRWVPAYLRSAFPFGASLQVSNLLVLMTARLDLVLVYRLADASTAGGYSVALTIGTIVASVPTALAYASFPRLAALDDDEARRLTADLFRVGVVAALLCGGAVALAVPTAIPVIFGQDYRGAIAPTLLLVPGGVLWSGQWILCRAAAARGKPRPLLVSFVASFVSMVALDLVLIPLWGAVGAGLASLVGSVVGLLVCGLYYRQWGWDWSAMVPRRGDVAAVFATVRRLVLAVRR